MNRNNNTITTVVEETSQRPLLPLSGTNSPTRSSGFSSPGQRLGSESSQNLTMEDIRQIRVDVLSRNINNQIPGYSNPATPTTSSPSGIQPISIPEVDTEESTMGLYQEIQNSIDYSIIQDIHSGFETTGILNHSNYSEFNQFGNRVVESSRFPYNHLYMSRLVLDLRRAQMLQEQQQRHQDLLGSQDELSPAMQDITDSILSNFFANLSGQELHFMYVVFGRSMLFLLLYMMYNRRVFISFMPRQYWNSISVENFHRRILYVLQGLLRSFDLRGIISRVQETSMNIFEIHRTRLTHTLEQIGQTAAIARAEANNVISRIRQSSIWARGRELLVGFSIIGTGIAFNREIRELIAFLMRIISTPDNGQAVRELISRIPNINPDNFETTLRRMLEILRDFF